MASKIQAIRGMHDCLPKESFNWQRLEQELKALFTQYGYKEIRTPIVEETRLFTRSLGEVTDIVEKEMYTFPDLGDNLSLSLRPELTASIVRSGIEHGLFYNQIQKLWQIGPVFRYDKPQKGRYRQFHQADVEIFGVKSADADAEILSMLARLWKRLGIDQEITLEINSMGTVESRKVHREALINHFEAHKNILDEDSLKRLYTNPLRILDSKNSAMSDMLSNAPRLLEYLDEDSKNHFDSLCKRLDALKIAYTINHRIVRGMDYYTRTVFEWTTSKLGAQGTVCGGGRYDKMVEELGGRATPAIGFGIGIERILLLCEESSSFANKNDPFLATVFLGETAEISGMAIVEKIRDTFPTMKIQTTIGGGSMKSQMKRVDNSGALYALILGEDELKNSEVIFKDLRQEGTQVSVNHDRITDWLAAKLNSSVDK